MKRYLFVFTLLFCSIIYSFSNDYYRVDTRETYAYSGPSYWHERVHKYTYDDVVMIDAFQQDRTYVFARVAHCKPERWIALRDLELMTQQEIDQYLQSTDTKLSVGYPWAHFNPQLARLPFYAPLYWITVIMAIGSIICFILLYNEARDQNKLFAHILYGIGALGLLFWVFFFGTWQWLQIGVLWGMLIYPLSFTGIWEETILRNMVGSIVSIACIVTAWLFLRQWVPSVMNVGFFSWLLCIILTFVNEVIALAIAHPK